MGTSTGRWTRLGRIVALKLWREMSRCSAAGSRRGAGPGASSTGPRGAGEADGEPYIVMRPCGRWRGADRLTRSSGRSSRTWPAVHEAHRLGDPPLGEHPRGAARGRHVEGTGDVRAWRSTAAPTGRCSGGPRTCLPSRPRARGWIAARMYSLGATLTARRASWVARLWKMAVQHKVLSVSLAALVVGALALGGVWVGAQRRAAQQARLAQELGEHVKEMELFLRSAYGLPLHDVEREREVVRATLGRSSSAAAAARGPDTMPLAWGSWRSATPSGHASTWRRRWRQATGRQPRVRAGAGAGRAASGARWRTGRITDPRSARRRRPCSTRS